MTAQEFGDHLTRYALNLRVRYRRVAERSYRPEHGWIRDLNTRGAWVELPERIAARTALAIALDTPAGELPLVAHVAWTCPGLRDAPYLHGFRFTGVTPARRDRLRALVTSETRRAPRPPLLPTCRNVPTARHRLPSSARHDPGPWRQRGMRAPAGPRAPRNGGTAQFTHAVRPNRRRHRGRLGRPSFPVAPRSVVPPRSAISPVGPGERLAPARAPGGIAVSNVGGRSAPPLVGSVREGSQSARVAVEKGVAWSLW